MRRVYVILAAIGATVVSLRAQSPEQRDYARFIVLAGAAEKWCQDGYRTDTAAAIAGLKKLGVNPLAYPDVLDGETVRFEKMLATVGTARFCEWAYQHLQPTFMMKRY
jgi:hypothetical protein